MFFHSILPIYIDVLILMATHSSVQEEIYPASHCRFQLFPSTDCFLKPHRWLPTLALREKVSSLMVVAERGDPPGLRQGAESVHIRYPVMVVQAGDVTGDTKQKTEGLRPRSGSAGWERSALGSHLTCAPCMSPPGSGPISAAVYTLRAVCWRPGTEQRTVNLCQHTCFYSKCPHPHPTPTTWDSAG